ncbi:MULTISPECIES: hypothetical protein [Okeania]|uniref:hypothetical protein n=1 Tax=Okeania TaxID=1458928 RepID=UPI000F52A270|nr:MULTISPECIES: hypothetical protein [Okeania]NET18684.1 hypothetical protein [Okeania sp. SIO1H5]NET74789.1 hypothetical protein [Okeania sp. SIO1F9]NET92331.1 hypothetical protein [Okeania sp. SIO1H2]RQH18526.1 hypothetical protein D4Z78_15600 [Okeania hirsuta]
MFRVCAQKSFSRGRRQETTHPSPLPLPGGEYRRQPTPRPSQEGRNGNEQGARSKNCPKIVLPKS